MKNLSIILACIVVTMISCTKSKEVHPEVGDGNDEIVTVGVKDVHVKYTRTDHAELNRVVFHYCPADTNGNAQQFEVTEMTKKETFFELTLNDLLSDTLYWYYYELFPNGSNAFTTAEKTFRTQAFDAPTPPTPPIAELPTVVTGDVSEITINSAKCCGEVTNNGGAVVTECGICWSKNSYPSLEDDHVAAGTEIGGFTATISGLDAATTYYFRAYAINEVGTAYGMNKEFTTLTGGGGNGNAPVGAIDGLFTINENGDQVYFSQGNLQYQASTNTWRFAEHQWDFVGTEHPGTSSNGICGGNVEGSDNYYISEDYDGWIDLFNWGTSGYNHGANYYHPWNIGGEIDDYYAYGCNYCSLFDNNGQADWGYNAISNGGNAESLWRTLTGEEWDYVINHRRSDSGIRFAKAKVNGVNGLILLPDGWMSTIYSLNCVNQEDTEYDENTIDESIWRETLQYNGAVFLPAAGHRQRSNDNEIDEVTIAACYWSSTLGSSATAYYVGVYRNKMVVRPWEFWFGSSVRLVQDAH